MSLQVIINSPSPETPSTPPTPLLPEEKPKKFSVAKFLVGSCLALILMGAVAFGAYFYFKPELISPLGTARQILGFGDIIEKPNKIVYGFLPYWNFKYTQEINLDSLTHLALFGLSFEADGKIKTRELNYAEPGWRNLTSPETQVLIAKAHQKNILVTVAITGFDNKSILDIISDKQATQTMIKETIEFVELYKLDGVNIDFEYVGTPQPTDQAAFTQMVQSLTQALKQRNPNYHVSIDVYADSANNDRIWDIKSLGQIVDHILIMAYDFHRPASPIAGPVAPIFGAGQGWRQDIVTLLDEHMEINPPAKLIIGVPFYGYEWRTADSEYLSSTINGTGRLASYRRVKELIQDKGLQTNWNNQSLSPWLVYQEEDFTYQIQYEDIRSLGFKYDLVNQVNAAGIGIWALGYEGISPEMWTLIQDKF